MLGVESATSIPQIIVWGRRDLRVLAQGAGRVLTHEDLLRQVWARRGKANPKIVRAYVKRLRHQLGDDAARPAWIVNERGVGYRMARPGEPGEP